MMAGDFGSTVSRYCTSERSSMRPPLSPIEPFRRGVSIGTRAVWAMTLSRDTVTVGPAPGTPGACGAPAGGAPADGAPGALGGAACCDTAGPAGACTG